ncbi:hypothetical protein BN938_2356 [Mucinivorans hirudinis]|uniref:DUF3078 domain-containing protein n=1 Tax=Mucinivorans hirudinis TaxID=1433126 RepID=A0A060RA23_9BACT|nr:hypothetical protein BN938_2356 [Mucinivorans hirudinis]
MKRILAVLISFLLFSAQNQANGQFTQKSNIQNISTLVDTLKIKDKGPDVVNIKIFDEAYNNYLLMLQRRHRNWVQIKSGWLINQTSFSNWAAGGNNYFASRTFLNVEHKYTAPTFNIHSIFDGAFGLQTTDGVTRKSEDYFKLSITPSWRLARHWEISASVLFNSQFANSFIPPADVILAASFMAPGYLTGSVGMKYNNLSKTLEVYVAPASGMMLFVLNEQLAAQGRYGEKGRKVIPKLINYNRVTYKKGNLVRGMMSVFAQMETYWDYQTVPRMVGELKFDFKFTKILGANIRMQAIYDDKINTPSINAGGKSYFQFTETVGFGLTYNFTTPKHPAPPEAPRKKR